MPKLDAGMTSQTITGTNFSFQGARIEDLGATEYTLATTVVDESSSVYDFADELLQVLVNSVESNRKSPRSENLLVRSTAFSSPRGVREIHGFKTLSTINLADYQPLQPYGSTPLIDAVDNAVGASADYAKQLYDNDFSANAIVVVITDGEENSSTTTAAMVKRRLDQIRKTEVLESIVTVLVGINAGAYRASLTALQRSMGFDSYIDAGDASPDQLAKVAGFISRSVSSQSQALGTGGPSQAISATI